MARFLSPARLAGAAAGLVVLAALVLYIVPSSDFLLLPDKAHSGRAARARAGRHRPAGARRHLLRRRVRAPREHARVALPVHPLRRDARPGEADRAARGERQRPAPRRPARDVDLAARRRRGRAAHARLQGRRTAGRRGRRRRRARQPRGREAAADRRDRVGERHEDAHDLAAARDPRARAPWSDRHAHDHARRGAQDRGDQDRSRSAGALARARRLHAGPVGGHPPAAEGADRRGQRRRPIGRARVRARGDGGARPPHRPRLSHRRDGADRARRHGLADRRREAEDVRRARGEGGRLPRARWG